MPRLRTPEYELLQYKSEYRDGHCQKGERATGGPAMNIAAERRQQGNRHGNGNRNEKHTANAARSGCAHDIKAANVPIVRGDRSKKRKTKVG